MYWAIVTASTVGYGDTVPKKKAGKILACIVIIISLPFFGFFIAQMSAELTKIGMQSNIKCVEDLKGKTIGVVRHTTSEEWADKHHKRAGGFSCQSK